MRCWRIAPTGKGHHSDGQNNRDESEWGAHFSGKMIVGFMCSGVRGNRILKNKWVWVDAFIPYLLVEFAAIAEWVHEVLSTQGGDLHSKPDQHAPLIIVWLSHTQRLVIKLSYTVIILHIFIAMATPVCRFAKYVFQPGRWWRTGIVVTNHATLAQFIW
jgi:hypothetical protein